jgi:hypothetical protein
MESDLNEEERLEIASNPATKPEVLSTLSTDESVLVRHCVGSNPSTSNKVLQELASDSSAFVRGAVAENSTASVKILSQLLGDTCHFVENKADKTLRAIARNTETKTVTLEELSKFVDPREGEANAFPWVRCEVAENPSTPQKTLKEFLLSEDEKSYVALNSGAGTEILESLSRDENRSVRYRVASNPSSTHKILENLARDPDEEVRREVLTNEGASLEIIEKILSEISDYDKEAFARRRNCSRELLTLLASDSKPSIRYAVAENTNTPSELLKILSKDDEKSVRSNVARNPSSVGETLDYLSKDVEIVVRTSVGDNTSSSPATLESLSSDLNTVVRAAVGGNPSSTSATLRQLSSDPYTSVRAAVASNPSADLAILNKLAADPKSLVRLEVAGNSEASPDILSKLSSDLKASIRESVSGNLNTNRECLSNLLRDKKLSVRLEVARNPNLSPELQKELAVDTRATVRAEVAKNSQVGAEVLQVLSKDLDKEVRLSVAQNSGVPNEILTTFLIDESHLVREAANTRLRGRFQLAQTGISSTSCLGRELLDFKRVTEFFDEAVFLNKNEAYQASVDILYELAEEGHLNSIIELVYTFMGQEDFEVAQEVLDFFPDPNNPRILYLKALLQEKNEEFDYEAYLTAAEAGSANAALVLFERNFASDRKVAKYWLTKAESIGHHNLQKYLEMWDFKPKQFIVATARDETGSLTGVSIFRHDTEELLEEPNSIGEAIQFCITADGGFDFQEDYYEEFDPIFRVKIFPDSQRIVIAERYHDYWFGEYPSDLDAAIEELCSRDCDWDLVFEDNNSALEEESE